MAHSLDTDHRRAHEESVVKHYYEVLTANGVNAAGYSYARHPSVASRESRKPRGPQPADSAHASSDLARDHAYALLCVPSDTSAAGVITSSTFGARSLRCSPWAPPSSSSTAPRAASLRRSRPRATRRKRKCAPRHTRLARYPTCPILVHNPSPSAHRRPRCSRAGTRSSTSVSSLAWSTTSGSSWPWRRASGAATARACRFASEAGRRHGGGGARWSRRRRRRSVEGTHHGIRHATACHLRSTSVYLR